MDFVLLVISIILLLTGIIGCFLPLIPGPPLSFLALFILHFTRFGGFTAGFLLLMAVIAAVVTIVDLLLPVWSAGKWGGSKYGVWGAAVGLLAGILTFTLPGMIIGPVAGAIAGELLRGRKAREAVVAGLAAFAGFMMGMGLKLAASLVMTFYFTRAVTSF
jgi:uncharacterized protein